MARPKSSLINFENQLKEIRKHTIDMPMEQRAIFESTLERYEVLVKQSNKLRIELEKSDLTVTKSYVKGRENIVINPLIGAYNQTVSTANKTAETLTKIIKGFADSKEEKPDDPLMEILNGTVE